MKRKSRLSRSIRSGLTAFFILLGTLVFFGGLIWSQTSGCSGDPDHAKRLVEDAGYTKVEVGGARGYRCGRDDNRSNTFSAIGPNGRYVEGVVCCSFMGCAKGCTLRFE